MASERVRGRVRRFANLLASALLLAVVIPGLPVHADDPVTRPTLVGTLDRQAPDVAARLGRKTMESGAESWPNGTAVISSKLDRIYQIWNFYLDDTSGTRLVVAERDLGTLKLGRVVSVMGRNAMRANNGSSGTVFISTLDEHNDRLFIEYGYEFFDPSGGPQETLLFGILAFDLKRMTYTDNPFPRGLVRLSHKGQAVYGLEYDESTDTLLALLSGFDENFAVANVVSIAGWPSNEFDDGGTLANMQGPRIIRSCRQNPIAGILSLRITPITIAPGPDLDSLALPQPIRTWVVIPCYNTPYSVVNVLVRMDRETLFQHQGSEKAIPAPSGISNWIEDTSRGRLHLLNTSQETDDWVYEVATNAFIGLIELSPKGTLQAKGIGLGIDDRTGRLFAFGRHENPAGKLVTSLMISEAGQDPVPQADIYNLDGQDGADAPVVVDGKRNRVFALRIVDRNKTVPTSWSRHYEIYKVPPPLPPNPEPDPDTLTKQVDEAPGKTEADFGGTASAYGARVLLSSGFSGIAPSNGNDTVGEFYRDANSQCGFRDREVVLGGPTEAELGSNVRDALASAVTLDGASKLDFGQPSRCDLYFQYVGPIPPYRVEQPIEISVEDVKEKIFFSGILRKLDDDVPQAAPWEERFNNALSPHTTFEYLPAECTSPDQKDVPGRNSTYVRGETEVDCTKPGEITARAEGRATGALGTAADPIPVRFGRAFSRTRVYLDPEKGLVSEAFARVENIQVGPITIGFIENRAVSYAKGRGGTAFTEAYKPIIGAVSGPGLDPCALRCDIDALLPQINNALSGRAEVRKIAPDARLLRGSPGGYEAGIIKSEKQASSDNALVGDKSREVPALEIIIYNDNPKIGRARQLVQLAAVRADSHYGIQVLDEGCPECGGEPTGEPTIIPGPVETQIVEVAGPERIRTVVQRSRPRVAIPGGYRLLLATPRLAGTLLPVWLLFAAPFAIGFRRRRLRTLR